MTVKAGEMQDKAVSRTIQTLTFKAARIRKNRGPGFKRLDTRGSHRGFFHFKRRNLRLFEHMVWRMFPAIPRKFTWTGELDVAKLYIDAWYIGDRKTTARFEQQGLAIDLQMVVPDDMTYTHTAINAHRLFDALALCDTLDVPIWNQVTFLTDGQYLVPCDFVTALGVVDPGRFGHLDPKKEWRRATPVDLQKMGLKPEQVTSGMYLNRKPAATATVAPGSAPAADFNDDQVSDQVSDQVEAPQAPPRERTLSRRDRVDYIEWVTEIEYEGQRPYYCRRLYRDQRAMYEATSFNISGPWTVYFRDNNSLLALGVDP